jgi:hypothetical protein
MMILQRAGELAGQRDSALTALRLRLGEDQGGAAARRRVRRSPRRALALARPRPARPRRPSRVDTTSPKRSVRHVDQCSIRAVIPAPMIPLAQATWQRAGLAPGARTA